MELGFRALLMVCLTALLIGLVTYGIREELKPLVEQVQAFVPQPVPATAYKAYPEACRITEIPWTPEKKAYCATVSFQMALAAMGQRQTLDTVNWFTGYTYGAYFDAKEKIFYFGSHTNLGIQFAAPQLGVVREYYYTKTREEFVRAVKSFVSQGQPVEVSLNSSALLGVAGLFSAHSELITGYDEKNFFVYETSAEGQSQFFRSSPTVGNLVPVENVVKAVADLTKRSESPGAYAFTVFGPGAQHTNYAEVWKRNGELSQGQNKFHFYQGAEAITALATGFAKLKPSRKDASQNPDFYLEWGRYSRADNAAFIRQSTPEGSTLRLVAELFDGASECYRRAHEQRGKPSVVQQELEFAAGKERFAGELMIRYADTPTSLPAVTEKNFQSDGVRPAP
jgi:hypothetical protein